MSDEQNSTRALALKLAHEAECLAGGAGTTASVLNRAKAYMRFLIGPTPPADPAKEPE